MSRSSILYELQLIDSQLDQNQIRLQEVARILADKAEIFSAESHLKATNEFLMTALKSLRDAEMKVKTQRLKIKQTDGKLYGGKVRNPKELQDLQDESESLKRFLSVLEDRQLECMLEVDDKKDQMAAAKDVHNKAIEKKRGLHSKLSAERSEIEKENLILVAKRHSNATIIPQDDLNIYERLRKQRFGVAVSVVNDRACSACGATLSAALGQSARSPSQITNCETCGRILCAN
jgi:predicted  nucleic acid-binding Zn-ribbon protein